MFSLYRYRACIQPYNLYTLKTIEEKLDVNICFLQLFMWHPDTLYHTPLTIILLPSVSIIKYLAPIKQIRKDAVNIFNIIIELLTIPWWWSVFIGIASFEFYISYWVYLQNTCDKSPADNIYFSCQSFMSVPLFDFKLELGQ